MGSPGNKTNSDKQNGSPGNQTNSNVKKHDNGVEENAGIDITKGNKKVENKEPDNMIKKNSGKVVPPTKEGCCKKNNCWLYTPPSSEWIQD